MSKGKIKAAWLDTPEFEQSTNFKEFFLKSDALCNIESEMAFSIFHRYNCKADCKMCYVQGEWLEDDVFANKFVPSTIPPGVESRILEVFSYFDVVSSTDDLFYIKNNSVQLLVPIVGTESIKQKTAVQCILTYYDAVLDKELVDSTLMNKCLDSSGIPIIHLTRNLRKNASGIIGIIGKGKGKVFEYKITGPGQVYSFEIINKLSKGEEI